MRIDPSQLSSPLAHILGAGATDAASGQRTAADAAQIAPDPQIERLDQLLLARLRANSASDAATSVVNFQDALERIARIEELAAQDPGSVQAAQGELDRSRVRGLLGH